MVLVKEDEVSLTTSTAPVPGLPQWSHLVPNSEPSTPTHLSMSVIDLARIEQQPPALYPPISVWI